MTAEQARRSIVLYSLLTTVAFSVLLILSPLFVQIDAPDAYRVLQIVFPVFAGYLGTAVLFLFRSGSARETIADQVLLRHLVHFPFYIFWAIAGAVFFYYYWSNRPGGVEGMKPKELSDYITLIVSFMNATVGALTAFLFDSEQLQRRLGIDAGSSDSLEVRKPPPT